jgi:hypothetical protein
MHIGEKKLRTSENKNLKRLFCPKKQGGNGENYMRRNFVIYSSFSINTHSLKADCKIVVF